MKVISGWVLVVLIVICGFGCSKFGGGDEALVKNGFLEFDKTISVGQAFGGYKYFKTKQWSVQKTEQGRRIVEFVGDMDMKNPEVAERIEMVIKDLKEQPVTGLKTIIQFVINADNTFQPYALSLIGVLEDGKSEKEIRSMSADYIIKQIYKNEAYGAYAFVANM